MSAPRKAKILGFVPARMAATRFPGKPLHPIAGRPMIEHVFLRAQKYADWDGLFLATCDEPIAAFGRSKGWPVIMTSSSHTRCLDRIAEAATLCGQPVADDDIIVCVQGDEPMLQPAMVSATIEPLTKDPKVACTVLAMEIAELEQFLNPDTVKLIADDKGDVLYTSRAPIPYCKQDFSLSHGALRIHGIFAFRWRALQAFTRMAQTHLEIVEACDSNRILDMDFRQRAVRYPYHKSYSVDSPADIGLVEAALTEDPLARTY